MIIRNWTPAEDKLLLDLSAKYMTYAEIADTLQRSRGSVRNRLSRLRNGQLNKQRGVIINLTAGEFYALMTAEKECESLKEKVQRLENKCADDFGDYVQLYNICRDLIKSYRNHRNMKDGIERLEAEMTEHFPIPY
jgi:predicted transcriptional regulator